MAVYDAVRSVATNTMLVALLFTLARPKYRWRVMGIAMAVIVLLNFLLNQPLRLVRYTIWNNLPLLLLSSCSL